MARSVVAPFVRFATTRKAALGAVALGAVVLTTTACAPVATPAPPPAAVAAPQVSACSTPVTSPEGKTQYLAVVDNGSGTDEAVTFDAATPAEQDADVAAIEATEGDVVAVEVDQLVQAAGVTAADEPMYVGSAPYSAAQAQYGINQATFPDAWAAVPAAGAPIKVAVLDTGVQASHPDLAGAVVSGTDFMAPGDGTNDQNGHGTHVAGILGARDQGIGGIGGAPMVTIVPVRVLGADGTGNYSGLINGINWAVANGAQVINMSLLGGGASTSLQTSVANAIAAGVVVIAAAGNDGTCNALYPAVYPGVIAVGATQQGSDAIAAFSQHGPDVDIAAPGSNIWSTFIGSTYKAYSGTSMAAPFVSAAAALLLAKCPAYTPAQVEARLEATAQPIAGTPIQQAPQSGALRAGAATALPC